MACDIYASWGERSRLLFVSCCFNCFCIVLLLGTSYSCFLSELKTIVEFFRRIPFITLAVSILKSLEPFLYLRHLNQLRSLQISFTMQFRTIAVVASLSALTVAQSLPACAVCTF